jgi:hypothetical protein
VGGHCYTLATLPPRRKANTYSTRDWVGPSAGGVPDISLGPGFNPWTIQVLPVNVQKEKCGIKNIHSCHVHVQQYAAFETTTYSLVHTKMKTKNGTRYNTIP